MVVITLIGLLLPSTCIAFLFHPRTILYAHRRFRRPRRLLPALRTAYTAPLILTAVSIVAGRVGILDLAIGILLLVMVAQPILLRFMIPTIRAQSPHSILVVAAHPDDLEIAVGGTLAKFIDRGHRVHALVMSHGAAGGDAEVRPHEARAGAGFLGLTSLTLMDLPDRHLESAGPAMIDAIENLAQEHSPQVILTHSDHDTHQDHHSVHLAVLRAARNHSSILCFESPSVRAEFDPRVFMEIGDYSQVKSAGIATHADQSTKGYMSDQVVDGISAFRGRQARLERAEAFEVVRLQLNDLLPL